MDGKSLKINNIFIASEKNLRIEFKEYLTRANTLYHQRHEATRLKAEVDEQHQQQQNRDWHEHRDRIVNDLRP